MTATHSLRPLALVLITLGGIGAARGAEYFDDAGLFDADLATWCEPVVLDFEDQPFGDLSRFAWPDIHFVSFADRPQVDDQIGFDGACVGDRCLRTTLSRRAGVQLRSWLRIEFTLPTPAVGFYLIDGGSGLPDEHMTITLTLADGARVEHRVPARGDGPGGSIFFGAQSDPPIATLEILAPNPADAFGLDDVHFAPRVCIDLDGDGLSPFGGDCADDDPQRSPTLAETCDGIDNDCDGVVPPDEVDSTRSHWLDCQDADGDGIPLSEGDCDPFSMDTFPGAPELCDGIDNNCDGEVPLAEFDLDHDGARACHDPDGDGVTEADGDCAPRDSTVFPGAPELCDGIDNDCDGVVPEREHDRDLDDILTCQDPDQDGVAEADGDCNPFDPTVYPGAEELCDGIDNDCDGVVPEREHDHDLDDVLACQDPDQDGVTEADGDCDPFDPTVYPGAEELCDGIDNDCVDSVPDREADLDRDGILACEDPDQDGQSEADGDCAPFDRYTYRGAPELCDGIDNDCDGIRPKGEADEDRDGFMICEGDCADRDPTRYPGAPERDNGWDDNCDGHETGGTVGCTAAPTRTPRGRGAFRTILSIVCLLWFAQCLLRRRRRRALAALPVALFVTGLAISDELDPDEVLFNSVAYQEALEASNHGRQLIAQISEHMIRDGWLRALVPRTPSLRACHVDGECRHQESCLAGRCTETRRIRVDRQVCINGVCVAEVTLEGWINGIDVTVLDGERIETTLSAAGLLFDASGLDHIGELYGPIVVTHDLSMQGTCHDPNRRMWLELSGPRVDADALVFDSYLDADALRQGVIREIEGEIARFLERQELDLTTVICDAIDNTQLPADFAGVQRSDGDVHDDPALLTITPGAGDVVVRTVPAPRDGAEPFIMLGWDPVALPDCHPGRAAEHPLFRPEAFEDFETSLIAPGKDFAVSLSTRVLRRILWNLAWNLTDDTGHTTRETFESAISDAEENDFYKSTTVEYYTHWEGLARHPIADGDEDVPAGGIRLCDGDIDGTYLLDLDTPTHPRLRNFMYSKLVFGCGCIDTDVITKVDLGLRLYIDSSDGQRPQLAVEREIDTDVDPGCLAERCASEDVDETRQNLANIDFTMRTAIPNSLLTVAHDLGDGVTLLLDEVTPHPATLTFSGRARFDLYRLEDGPWPRPPTPLPQGAIAGLNVNRPAEPIRVDGLDPTHLNCPGHWKTRWVTIDGARFEWCEAQAREDDPFGLPLPAGAWCGVDVHPRHREEICDGVDNNGDGLVDNVIEIDGFEHDPTLCDAIEDEQEYVSQCEGFEPRFGCPAGYTAFGVWYDEGFRVCRYGPDGDGACGVLEDATIVTCVSEGVGFDPLMWPEMPGGLLLEGEVTGYSERAAMICPGPTHPFRHDTGWRGVKNLPVLTGMFEGCVVPDPGRDVDADDLSDAEERALGTDRERRSTDGDPFPDGHDVWTGLDPHHVDSDRDGLSDLAERYVFGTDPSARDTDRDGLPDGYEVYVTGDDPDVFDSDDDGIPDGQEEDLLDVDGPDLDADDRDGDGLPDGYERWVLGTDPDDPDTDGDGVPDGAEPSVPANPPDWYAGEPPAP